MKRNHSKCAQINFSYWQNAKIVHFHGKFATSSESAWAKRELYRIYTVWQLRSRTIHCIAATPAVSPTLYQAHLRISNHKRTQFRPSLTLLSFKTRVQWPPVWTATASFPSILFQFLQYSRQRPCFLAQEAHALMTKTDLTFQHFLYDL